MPQFPSSARRLTGAFLALALATSFTSAYAQSAPDTADRLRGVIAPITAKKPFTIGVTLVHLQDDFWKGMAYGIIDEAKRSNVKVLPVAVAGGYGNVQQQFAQLDALQARGADVVVLGAAAFDGYNPILKRLKQSGTTVIAAGIPVNSEGVTFGIGQSDKAIGVALAQAICADTKGTPASVAVIPGPAGAEWANLRHEGFEQAAAACKQLKLEEAPVGGQMTLESGIAQTSDILQKHPDIKYVYTPAIALAMGAVQAGRHSQTPPKVVTGSIVKEAIPDLKDGRLLAVASEPGILIGRLVVQYAIRQHEGLPMPRIAKQAGLPYPEMDVPLTIINKETAKTYPFTDYDIVPAGWSIGAQ